MDLYLVEDNIALLILIMALGFIVIIGLSADKEKIKTILLNLKKN